MRDLRFLGMRGPAVMPFVGALGPSSGDGLLLESGDFILLESGDFLLLE